MIPGQLAQYGNHLALTSLLLLGSAPMSASTAQESIPETEDTRHLTIPLPVPAGDYIYKESLTLRADHPAITLSHWQSTKPVVTKYDATTDRSQELYKTPVAVTFTAHAPRDANISNAHAHLSYQRRSDGSFHVTVVPLQFAAEQIGSTESTPLPDSKVTASAPTPATAALKCPDRPARSSSWGEYISDLLKTTKSTWVQLMLALLLGLLLSLTPCIYPMIPITTGIIQAHASTSVWYNFLLSLSYTVGLSTTFALLGLLAAFAGQMVGSLMTNPIFVLCVVAMLVYLALSMLGFYEMYTPKLPGMGNSPSRGGSFLSCFALGAASGTVSSPCVSPGLMLLLTVVTTMGSKLLGFVLLFFFGLGLSAPLLVIGTFSGSLNILPKAGAWMVEIKKLFGFMMLAMCFYFLRAIIPAAAVMWGMAALALACGLFYLRDARQPGSPWRLFKNIVGVGSVAGSVIIAAMAFTQRYHEPLQENIWLTQYSTALKEAREQTRKIFVDIGAPYCSLCRAIDKKLFTNDAVIAALKKLTPVKIDASETCITANCELQKRMKVVGTPTCILIDPANDQEVELCRWGGELYDVSPEEFIETLRKYGGC